jgi:cell division septum initiation protein DivIVA
MGEHEMFKTTLMGGYDKEEVQELIQKMKDEMAEVQVNYRKQLAERDERIAELQKRIELKDAYQARMEEDIKEKYQKYIDNYESIGKLVFEAQLKSDSMQREAEEKCSKMIEEAEAEAKRRVESVQSEIDDKLLEGKKKYLAVQEEMNGIVELINQAQKRFMSSYKEVHQIINSMPTSLNDIEDVVEKLEGNSSDEILDTEEEIHLGDTQELDILDAVDDISDLEEFDEEDAEEDEDSKLAMQISKLLSEEDEAMMEEDLEDFFKE